jgi:phosphopantetheinyl transferase (holo-ACP synthase)
MSALEIMCETARMLLPRMRVASVENLRSQRWLEFREDMLKISVRAERIAWSDSSVVAVRVQLREESRDSNFTWPAVEAVVILATGVPTPPSLQASPLERARSVNWSHHDIYPERLFQGESLRIVRHVDLWSEGGIDFEVEAPRKAGSVKGIRVPLFSVWPQLLDGAISAFTLWRSHEKFAGAISLPFRCRRIFFHTLGIADGARLRGYFRLTAVTPRSHVGDILVTDGNGTLLLEFRGCEELCERVPPEYQQFILRPSEKFITDPFPLELLGNSRTPAEACMVANVPMHIFEPHQELWLKTLAGILLSPSEREEWNEMQGSTSRRTEWLFGRAVAKEAVRKFLQRYHQAHWTDADIPIWPDDSGKPHPLGMWREHADVKMDLSIAHTEKLIVAAVVANARIGIDVEAADRALSEDFTRGVFSPAELELAVATGNGPEAMLRFWCAKEAISKALGTGIRFPPRELVIRSFDAASGVLTIELTGQWLTPFKKFTGRMNELRTCIYRDHAFASCLLPEALFGQVLE